jgi:hypothetical protein
MTENATSILLTPDSAKAYILGSGTYWSAKELSAHFKTTPANVNVVMKGLAQLGSIAHYYVPFELEVGGKKIEAKKYFYAKWLVKVPSSFNLVNTQWSQLLSSQKSMTKATDFYMGDHLSSSHAGDKVGHTTTISEISWKGTYKSSPAYQDIFAKKKGKTPNEHVLAFFKHYHQYTFTMRFLAAYFDCTVGHITGVIKVRMGGSVETWAWCKGINVAGGSKTNHMPIYIDLPPVNPAFKVSELDKIIANIEKAIEFEKFSGSVTGTIKTQQKTVFGIPKLGSDPTKKVQFEVEYTKTPTSVLDTGIVSIESTNVAKIWGLKPLNLLRECADLYVLYDLSLDFNDVLPKLEEKLDFLADQFSKYLDMALGGEFRDGFGHCSNWEDLMTSRDLTILRYMKEGKFPHESSEREKAQIAWKNVREELGMKALEEVYQVFHFGDWGNGSYGGSNWATAAKTLINYLKGEYSKMIFVDTVWTMQHNCDFILNKAWKVKGLANLLKFKQEGCMIDLYKFASPVVATLYKEKRQTE